MEMRKRVVIESTIKDGAMNRLLPFLKDNLPNVRGFAGCLNVTVFLGEESRKMVLSEDWLSVEDHQRYINAISENGVMGELVAFFESAPEIKYFDRLDL
jgi:quinol monooxygenase YgiN